MHRIFLFLILFCAGAAHAEPVAQGAPNAPEYSPAFPGQTRAPEVLSGVTPVQRVFASGLENPWGIAALPGGGYLVTERPGRLRYVSAQGVVSAPIAGVPKVLAQQQGGLLDVSVSPEFGQNRVLFLSYAKPLDDGRSVTAVARAVLSPDRSTLTDLRDIFLQDPPSGSPMHYGSRVVIDRRGDLFITTGEHFSRSERVLAQDIATTFGKVVHLSPDGLPVGRGGLPLGIWSLGHRNVQGAAIQPGTGDLWTVEHGPAGGDELNRPEAGKNYGWPVVSYGKNYNGSPVGEGRTQADGMTQPIYYWDPVIAPGGMIFYTGEMFPEWWGSLLIGSLNPGGLVRLSLLGDRVTGEERFFVGDARIRDVEQAPDGALLLLVDAPDGAIWRISR
ncbi:PQQ-dependent sugar dehydrogenase [Actibacterium ureilyticum]|uniref:PQQ-dependent sugar dehydrogenase n=1 Tax=Actibacterium ureilyticum TaxID=1590614 RepID=UPI000BAAE285|nr:PQQ-dependent sugar dehydrogenase [Actibacterium ureilyticum]